MSDGVTMRADVVTERVGDLTRSAALDFGGRCCFKSASAKTGMAPMVIAHGPDRGGFNSASKTE